MFDLVSKTMVLDSHERKMEMDLVDMPEVDVKLETLSSLRKLGEGQFGKVYLVCD